MNYGYGSDQMMGGGWLGTTAIFTWLVWLVAGVLLIVWLWQNIKK
ncbi:MAG TPA: hypothetical protein VJH70_00235 [Candidatus Paceibacterota bacterium]